MAVMVVVLCLSNTAHLHAQTTHVNKDGIKEVYPDEPFDLNEAKAQMDYGASTIQGVVYTRLRQGRLKIGSKVKGNRVTVTIYPVTKYFEAWYDLRKKKEGKKTRVFMCDAAYRQRIEVYSDSDGNFEFKELKPGRYFLQSFIDFTQDNSYDVQQSHIDVNARTIYQWKERIQKYDNYDDRLEEFVDIKTNGEIVKVKLH